MVPSWYPGKGRPGAGIFIQKHVFEITKYCHACILNFEFISDKTVDQKRVVVENGTHESITEVTIYIVNRSGVLGSLINIILINYYFIKEAFLFRRFRYNLIHIHVIYHIGLYIFPYLLFTRIPIVITEHWTGYYDFDGRYKKLNILARKVISFIFRKAKAVTVVSETLGKKLHELFSVGDKTIVVGNVLTINKELLPVDLVNEDKFRFLVIANLDDRQKNISGIIDAFSKVKKQLSNINIHLTIVGEGKDREKLALLARESGMSNSEIEFSGYVENSMLRSYYAKSHCYIMNSNFETFSISTAEALLNGLPVISTKCGGPEEYINDRCGVLIEVGNTKLLESSLLHIIHGYDKYNRNEIIQYAQQRFQNVAGEQFYKLYQNII